METCIFAARLEPPRHAFWRNASRLKMLGIYLFRLSRIYLRIDTEFKLNDKWGPSLKGERPIVHGPQTTFQHFFEIFFKEEFDNEEAIASQINQPPQGSIDPRHFHNQILQLPPLEAHLPV
ncbi:hypothetical protein QJS04_geneDACA019093 [Acorus gramineus]|uniref:Uncharacterized protein n=1 Tax=Acorus gramineus TaxID=55184 RepID=A0AAV9A969_ACOGR|nr:hypothetical protein QJS04_geneDACA019093 [Acorus gramineus]